MKNPRDVLDDLLHAHCQNCDGMNPVVKAQDEININTALAQLEGYYHNCIRGQHQMVGENGMGATHCKICNLKVSELEKIYRMMSKEK